MTFLNAWVFLPTFSAADIWLHHLPRITTCRGRRGSSAKNTKQVVGRLGVVQSICRLWPNLATEVNS